MVSASLPSAMLCIIVAEAEVVLLLLDKTGAMRVRLPLPPRLDTGKVRAGAAGITVVETDSEDDACRIVDALESRRAPRPDRMRMGEYGGMPCGAPLLRKFELPCGVGGGPCPCIHAVEEFSGC